MAISTKPFHPLDVENNRRYKVTKKESPKIGWHKTEETGVHDWEGYIRVPEDGTYNFTIQIDDNGYLEINGEKVAELTGSHSSTSVSGSKELKKGFHYAKLHHENLAVPEEIAPYPNAEEFVPKMGNSELELWEIDAPKNLWNIANAQRLLGCYNVVDYPTMTTDDVWNYIGGWLNDSHVSGDANYINNCALRLSIALSSYGIDLNGAPGANNIGAKGNSQALGGKKHIIISTAQMAVYLRTLLGTPDYPDDGENGYNTPQAGDIIVFGDSLHVGMCSGNNIGVGSFISGPVWLLQRSTLDD